MCGRYSLVCIDDLGNRFRVYNPMIGARSRFNIAPGNEMPVIIRREENELCLMHWGLVPGWKQDPAAAQRPINIRAETLAGNPLFRTLLENGRCLVPASGFYEWKKEGKRKVPFYFYLPESPLFAFAGLSAIQENPEGTPRATYTIITCEATGLPGEVHNRMPVILNRENEERWLSRNPIGPQDLAGILAPCTAPALARVPVADRVNNPSVDDERLIRPLFGLSG
jgi:putative SOS response-associated peptidase YedK